MKKVLVTGVSGYLGHQCAVELLKNGYLVKGSLRDFKKKDGLFKYYSEDGVENSWSPQCWQNDKKVDLSICKQ